MDDIFVYLQQLPDGVNEMVTPCLDGYTVYIDPRLATNVQNDKYRHAVGHIQNDDFEKDDVQEIERRAHG